MLRWKFIVIYWSRDPKNLALGLKNHKNVLSAINLGNVPVQAHQSQVALSSRHRYNCTRHYTQSWRFQKSYDSLKPTRVYNRYLQGQEDLSHPASTSENRDVIKQRHPPGEPCYLLCHLLDRSLPLNPSLLSSFLLCFFFIYSFTYLQVVVYNLLRQKRHGATLHYVRN